MIYNGKKISYIAEQGKENVLVKELSPESISYSDSAIKAKTTYFYTIATENKSGKKMQVSGFNSNNTEMKNINSPIRFAPETITYF
jgi:hypothetical protein